MVWISTPNACIFAAVAEDAPLDGVLPIRYDELTVAETDLRLICHIFVEVGGDQFHTLALHTALIQFAGVDQLAAVDDHELVRRVDMDSLNASLQRFRFSGYAFTTLCTMHTYRWQRTVEY